MKLDLTKFDKFVKNKKLGPSELLEDVSDFDPSNLKGSNDDPRPCGNMNGVQHFPNSCDMADVIATRFLESTHEHIRDLSDNYDNTYAQQTGIRLEEVYEANNTDGSTIYGLLGEKIIAQVGNDILGHENSVEKIGEKLRAQKKTLAADIRKLMDKSQHELTTWATLTESLSRDWGADASIIAGLTWAMTSTAKTATNWLSNMFIKTGKINAGPIAVQFLNDNVATITLEALEANE